MIPAKCAKMKVLILLSITVFFSPVKKPTKNNENQGKKTIKKGIGKSKNTTFGSNLSFAGMHKNKSALALTM
jgi:hypothetical protein